MKRPSFQFYPADWLSDVKLQACSDAEQGIWMRLLCLMHDGEEYGVLQMPAVKLARIARCTPRDLQSLLEAGVLRGADTGKRCAAYVYTPKHAGREGQSVTLIPEQDGPVWFSARLVKDEYVRQRRGASTRFNDDQNRPPKDGPNDAPNRTPKGGIGGDLGSGKGYGPSSSSSSSIKTLTTKSGDPPDDPPPELPLLNGHDDPAAVDASYTAARHVLAFLNRATGHNFQAVEATMRLIRARIAESDLDTVKRVIAAKVEEWSDDPRMVEYLRPKTLFNATNFANYAGAIPRMEPAEHG